MKDLFMGIGWYATEETWAAVRAASVDPERFEDGYEEWLAVYSKGVENMERHGAQCIPVPMDPAEILAWCQQRNRPVNAAARAAFSVEKLLLLVREREE